MTTAGAEPPPITRLLQVAAEGDRTALDQIYASLYPDLKRIARARLRQQGRGDGMGTRTLLHESVIRLVNAAELRLIDRRHFFAYAARTMRNVIIDSAREHLAERRGGGALHETLGGDAVKLTRRCPASRPDAKPYGLDHGGRIGLDDLPPTSSPDAERLALGVPTRTPLQTDRCS